MRTEARHVPLVARITGLPGAPIASTHTLGAYTTLYLADGSTVEVFATDLVTWEPLGLDDIETSLDVLQVSPRTVWNTDGHDVEDVLARNARIRS